MPLSEVDSGFLKSIIFTECITFLNGFVLRFILSYIFWEAGLVKSSLWSLCKSIPDYHWKLLGMSQTGIHMDNYHIGTIGSSKASVIVNESNQTVNGTCV